MTLSRKESYRKRLHPGTSENDEYTATKVPYILESNPDLVFATFLNALLIRNILSSAPCVQADCFNNIGCLVCLFRYAMQQGAFHCLLTIR
jgi:hypothetical protein